MKPIAISKNKHQDQSWQQPSDYFFAKSATLVSLSIAEISKAATALPLAFAKQQGQMTPVAMLGLPNQNNLFVNPEGKWVGSYVPAALRAYPFTLLHHNDQVTLCVDQDSNLIRPDRSAKAFFNNNGEPTEEIQQMLEFLRQIDGGTRKAQKICQQLDDLGLIEPWQVSLQTAEGEQPLQNLYRINEKALKNLDGDSLIALRDSEALLVAYLQLLAVQHLDLFNKLLEIHERARTESA